MDKFENLKEEEKKLIAKQINFVKETIKDFEEKCLYLNKNINEFQIKYTAKKCIQKFIDWILLNDFEENSIEIKQIEILNIIRNIIYSKEVNSIKFENEIKKEVENLIKNLIQIK